MAPYVALSQAYGRDVEIVTLVCDVETALKRNVHNVPGHTIRRRADQLREAELPRHWSHRVVMS